ncbi:MAG TPA: hypothetical protein VG819_08870 [Rhizomicrobium sp.]|jgi:hypothetical protein|nr:hypothetical protein [Rhizomicrobium sp.]
MSWIIVAGVLAAGIAANFTDWYFMGVLHHDRYRTHPDTWWPRERSDTRPIVYSSALSFITAAAVVALCAMAGVDGIWSGIKVAFIAWLAGPFVQVVTTQIWVRMDWHVSVAHALGYLARFLIAGIAAGIVLPMT